MADVLPLPCGAGRGRPGRSGEHVSRTSVLKGGRSLERQVSLRSGARVQDALERLGYDVAGIDVGHDLVARLREVEPDVVFVALHGRDGEDGTVQELLEVARRALHRLGRLGLHPLRRQGAGQARMRDAGLPTPDFFAFNETAFKDLGAADALPAIEERLGLPDRRQAGRQGSALGIKFARGAADVPAALVAAFSYDRKVLLERHVQAATWPSRCSTGEANARALPVVEAVPHEEDFYDFEARYEIGRTDFVCPADLPGDGAERATSWRSRLPAAGLLGLRARGPDARRRDRRAPRARGQRDPRPDRDQPAAPGRRRGGDRLRRASIARLVDRGRPPARRGAGSRGARSPGGGLARPRSPRA